MPWRSVSPHGNARRPLAPQAGRLFSTLIVYVTWRLLSLDSLSKQARPHKAIVTDALWTRRPSPNAVREGINYLCVK